MTILGNRITAVVAGAAVIATLGSTAAFAANTITGDDVQDGTLTPRDFNKNVQTYFGNLNMRAFENSKSLGELAKDGNGLEDRVTDLENADPAFADLESDGPYPGATELQDGDNSTAKWVVDEGANLQQSWVMCAPGKTAVGGGFSRADEGAAAIKGLQIVTSQPVQVVDGNPQAYTPIEGDVDGSYVPNGWLVEGFNNGATELIVRPHVICATVN